MSMEIILGVIVLSVAVASMSIGVIFNRKPLSGSCGSINPDGICSTCGGNKGKCESESSKTTNLL